MPFYLFRSTVASNLAPPPPIENVSLRVPPSNLREFSLFCACPSNKHCPPARCAYAANVTVGKDLDIVTIGALSLNCICAPNCK
jgi:hypothetical protein